MAKDIGQSDVPSEVESRLSLSVRQLQTKVTQTLKPTAMSIQKCVEVNACSMVALLIRVVWMPIRQQREARQTLQSLETETRMLRSQTPFRYDLILH